MTKKVYVNPTHESAKAFWDYWEENGKNHKHGFYEATWGAINAALALSGVLEEPEGKNKLLPCVVCEEETPNIFGVNFNPIPVCESCANTITMQQIGCILQK